LRDFHKHHVRQSSPVDRWNLTRARAIGEEALPNHVKKRHMLSYFLQIHSIATMEDSITTMEEAIT
jgi:hypothetical protein